MDVYQIGFALGGCGNLINHCLKSNQYFDLITRYYCSIHTNDTWTNQEWNIRTMIGQQEHVANGDYNLVWDNSLDTSFHYIIKNIKINHLSGSILDRVNGIIENNKKFEHMLRQNRYILLDQLLQSDQSLSEWCCDINPTLDNSQIITIFNLWKEKTKLFFDMHSEQVNDYFYKLGIDYTPKTLYNILYENTYTR